MTSVAARHAADRLETIAVTTELKILDGLHASMQPHERFWREANSIPVKTKMPKRVRALGNTLNQEYRHLFQQIDARKREIVSPHSDQYDLGKGVDNLDRYYGELTRIRRRVPSLVAHNENDPYCRRMIGSFDNTIDTLSAGRIGLANRALTVANRYEMRRLFALRHGIRDYLGGKLPNDADQDILGEYERFLYELLWDIEERLRRISPWRRSDERRINYNISEGFRFFEDMERKLDSMNSQLEQQKSYAQREHTNNRIRPDERRLAYTKIRAVNYVQRNVYKPMVKVVADGRAELAMLEPPVSRVLAQNRWYSRARLKAGFRRAAEVCTSKPGIFAISTLVSFSVKIAVGAGLGPGLVVLPIAGAIAGAAAYAVRTKLRNEQFNKKSLAISVGLGAAGSLIGYGLGEFAMDGSLADYWHSLFGSHTPVTPATVVQAPPPLDIPQITVAPPVHTSLDDAKELLKHVPSSVHLSEHVESLLAKATSDGATAHDVIDAAKQVSFAEINLPGHDAGSVEYGYALIRDGWHGAQDNGLAGSTLGKELGLDWGYAQDIGAPGVLKDHQAAMDLAKELGSKAQNAWMKLNPWRAGLNLA